LADNRVRTAVIGGAATPAGPRGVTVVLAARAARGRLPSAITSTFPWCGGGV